MPTTINGTPTFANAITVPSAGDAANVASVIPAFQGVLNNAKAVFDQANSTGVLAVRAVADLAALKALTGMVDGQCAIVRKFGLFVYSDPDATTESLPWIAQPSAAGTGRWFHILESVRAASTGLATLASGKVPTAQLSNQIVALYQAAASGVVTPTSSGSYLDLDPITFPTVTGIKS